MPEYGESRYADAAEERGDRRRRSRSRSYGDLGDRGWGDESWAQADRWAGEQWRRPDQWVGDYGRIEYDRTGAAYRGWNEPEHGYQPAYGYDYRSGREYDRYGLQRESRSSGGFSGRGPKGYRRSDERIREDVCERLAGDSWLDASGIEVAVSDGDVTLSGTVRAREDKRRSEDLIEQIPGVHDVHNTLRVG